MAKIDDDDDDDDDDDNNNNNNLKNFLLFRLLSPKS
jgi:hypothetical protein